MQIMILAETRATQRASISRHITFYRAVDYSAASTGHYIVGHYDSDGTSGL